MNTDTTLCISFVMQGQSMFLDDLSKLITLEPTRSHSIGDTFMFLGKPKKRKFTTWEYEINKDTIDLEAISNILVDKISPFKREIYAYCKENNLITTISICCVIRNGQTPASHFNKELILFAAEIDAEIDFDIYVESAKEYEPIEGFTKLT